MLIGYMRVSKSDGTQTWDLQPDARLTAGVASERLYEDRASGCKDARPGLNACLKAFQPSNTLVVWKLEWSGIWPNIRDFTIEFDQLHWGASGGLAWAMVPWNSTGFHPDGTAFPRPGRATVIFERRDGKWLAIHTHFSLFPGTPQTTHGANR